MKKRTFLIRLTDAEIAAICEALLAKSNIEMIITGKSTSPNWDLINEILKQASSKRSKK